MWGKKGGITAFKREKPFFVQKNEFGDVWGGRKKAVGGITIKNRGRARGEKGAIQTAVPFGKSLGGKGGGEALLWKWPPGKKKADRTPGGGGEERASKLAYCWGGEKKR